MSILAASGANKFAANFAANKFAMGIKPDFAN
jgi:hypothetical protein